MTNSTGLNLNPSTVVITHQGHQYVGTEYKPAQGRQTITPADAAVIVASITALIAIVSWFVLHILGVRRDRENRAHALFRERETREHADHNAKEDRLRAYEGFLVEKEQITEATPAEKISDMYFSQNGLLNAGQFRKEAVKVRRDFPPPKRAEFDRLDDALGRMSPRDIASNANKTSREKLADAIRAVRDFVHAA